MSEQEKVQPEERAPRGLYERLKSEDDHWEMWAKIGVAMLVLQTVAFAVAYMRLGNISLYTHAVMIPMLGVLTLPISFWGLLRALFRPPIFRRSRTVGFVALVIVGLVGNQPMVTAPVSTGDWTADQEYKLPFDGEWVTLAGGEKRKTNYHATTSAHRWGYDFAPVIDGSRYTSDGKALEDHHCYGTPVRTPVGGTVIQAMGGEPDFQPGEFDPNNILGNHLVIRVGKGEYLFMANLKQRSLTVASGDEVEAGQKVAECGNSGRTTTPHLHIHLQNTRAFPISEGLPLRFSNYLADGESVELGMPVGSPDFEEVNGQIVENQQPWPELSVEDD